MKQRVVFGQPDMMVRQAAVLMAENNVGTLPVVDGTSNLVGVTTMKASLRRAANMSVADIVEDPVSVEKDCTLIRALSFTESYGISGLPVVREGKLVGLASRVDIGRAFLSTWLIVPAD